MGIRLVGYALSANWAHLSERARLVLAQMCYVAKDTSTNGHAPGTYWGGHQTLIITVLGQDPSRVAPSCWPTNRATPRTPTGRRFRCG